MIIRVQDLVKRYGDLQALDHLSFEVREGEIFGLLGPNGSGKTTAINCMLSLLRYDKGEIRIFDRPMTPESYKTKAEIGVVMQDVAVFDVLTVEQNIDYFCGLYVRDTERRRRLVQEAIAFTGLGGFEGFLPKKLSGGLLRRLNIACGIAHKPRLIFMDEPTVAVDPQSRNKILEGIKELNRRGATIIYTSHYMEEVEQICSRIMILDHGREIASGTKQALKSMIDLGEKNSFEVYDLPEEELREIRGLPEVAEAHYQDNMLVVKSHRGSNILERLLEFLRSRGIVFGRIYSEQPSLNDVFLEITGRELRDGGSHE
ncbi:ABC transporter ATP-binding protein [Spirochaeta lutea]|uniref:ABC transporter ATP-binding protein n=1 Tax=Spirochaeta lutea TaxID=1480694 RepID=A0A098R1Q5_9SPIO|nr:ABC transporter ATP-binding protein [Spirochaeta lutea]KGE73894.1 ABC transporter ATP-binding protein [Spirochaeta lutea]